MKNEKSPMKKIRKNRGITLIALVITIIVLLILAGVSISMLTGENGILKRANEAKEETQKATEDEQRKMAMLEAATNTELTHFQGVPIPAGFAPTRMPGESTVDKGLVITDSEGNEFVWIPVENYDEYEQADQLSKEWSSSSSYKNGDINGGKDGWENKPDPDDTDAMKNIKASVKKEKGFYVARYEAGVPTNADFYVDKNSENKTYVEKGDGSEIDEKKVEEKLIEERNVTVNGDKVDLKPVSKKGNQVWNFISQENAVKLSRNMYKNNSSVNSYLIDSNAWNYICKYIFETKEKIKLNESKEYGNYKDNATTNYEGIKGLFAKYIVDAGWTYPESYEYGNVPSEYPPRGKADSKNLLELATGSSDDFKIYNIYDMAGNMHEWTAEIVIQSPQNHVVCRGGGFGNTGSGSPIVHSCGDFTASFCYSYYGFRSVLYLK